MYDHIHPLKFAIVNRSVSITYMEGQGARNSGGADK